MGASDGNNTVDVSSWWLAVRCWQLMLTGKKTMWGTDRMNAHDCSCFDVDCCGMLKMMNFVNIVSLCC